MTNTSDSISTPSEPLARACAPGKLILSGEHSVVYGAPALAVAIGQFTEVWFKPFQRGEGLRTVFKDLSQGKFYPLKLLHRFKNSLDKRFDQFVRGDLSVKNILSHPDDLAVYTLASLLQHSDVPGVGAVGKWPAPGYLGSSSSLPIGAGMGSSSSTIAATFVLFEHFLDRPLTLQQRLEHVRNCDRLQHGKAGIIDAATVVLGGLIRAQGEQVKNPSIDSQHGILRRRDWYWVVHGSPASSTGECVEVVRAKHADDATLWQDFADCTDEFQTALEHNRCPRAVIQQNHQLLCSIGVVPEAAQTFIAGIEAAGGVAKICGAGSVAGDCGGSMLVYMPDPQAMTTLMSAYPGLKWGALTVSLEGAALCGDNNGVGQ